MFSGADKSHKFGKVDSGSVMSATESRKNSDVVGKGGLWTHGVRRWGANANLLQDRTKALFVRVDWECAVQDPDFTKGVDWKHLKTISGSGAAHTLHVTGTLGAQRVAMWHRDFSHRESMCQMF